MARQDVAIDPADPLAMMIVCDMWLTGTDIPGLHTLCVDKPMRGHTMIQAISRVAFTRARVSSGLDPSPLGPDQPPEEPADG